MRAVRSASSAVALAAILSFHSAFAASDGELWEMTTEMSMPGMPAGMGNHTTQQCQAKDWRSAAAQGTGGQQCTISDFKQTATRVTYKGTCPGNPPTTVSVDLTFEQNRSRVNGTMRLESRDGTMVSKMSGRRIGTCDVAQAAAQQQALMAGGEAASRDAERHQEAARGSSQERT